MIVLLLMIEKRLPTTVDLAPKPMQRELVAMLIASSGITQPDERSAIYEAVGKDDSLLKAIEE